MKKKSEARGTTFWFGFALGTIGTLGLLSLAASKKGRDSVKIVLEKLDSQDGGINHLIDNVIDAILDEREESEKSLSGESEEESHTPLHYPTIHSILERVKKTVDK